MQKLQTKRDEADRLEAEINEAFSAAEPTEIPKDEKSELSDLIEKLGLQSHSYTFSVVSLDSEIYVTGAYVESADGLDELGILGQFDEDFAHGDTVHAEISYYIIGQSGVESERLPDEFCGDIMSHLNTAIEYAECFPLAEGFLRHGHLDKEEENYKLGSFELHQACERYYKTFTLVYSGIRPKSHELKVLGAMVRSCSREFANVFPTHTFEDNKAFDKLCRAYIEARYNRLFTVSKEQYEYMLARTEVLREVTIRECAARMAYYDEMIEKEEKEKI